MVRLVAAIAVAVVTYATSAAATDPTRAQDDAARFRAALVRDGTSADDADWITWNTFYYANPRPERTVSGIRFFSQKGALAATPPLASENAGELRPGASVESDRDLLDYASRDLQTVYHPTSTCRMGSDGRAVVDPKLRLGGVEGLWVADASVMPSVPRGHPNAVVAMIARRAAGWIEAAVVG